jgi:hypothetical protein
MAEQNNHSMLKSDPQPCLNKQQVEDYVQGAMDKEASRHAELHLIDCPLCSDAIDAFLEQGLPAQWPKTSNKRLPLPKWYAVAASITAIGVTLSVMWGLQKEMGVKNESVAQSADSVSLEKNEKSPTLSDANTHGQKDTFKPTGEADDKKAAIIGNTTGSGVLASNDTMVSPETQTIAMYLPPGNSEPIAYEGEMRKEEYTEDAIMDTTVVSADLLSMQMATKQNRAMNNQPIKETSKKMEVVETKKATADYETLYKEGSYKESLALLDALPPPTRNPKEWLYMGKNLYALGQFTEAVESLKKVPEVSALYAESLWYRGLSLEGSGKAAEAREVFLRLSKLNSEFKKDAEKKLK